MHKRNHGFQFRKDIPPVPKCGLTPPGQVKCGQTRGLCDVCKLCPDHCLGHFQLLEGRIVGNYAVRVRS